MAQYLIANGPMPTTAAFAPVTTGTAIKTMLQVKPFNLTDIVAWGISFNGFVAALPIRCELIETGTVFATVTASVDADITKYDDPNAAAASIAGLTLGTAATGYTATAEGSVVAVRLFDVQFVAPTNQYSVQFPLGCRPKINIGASGRIRVTAAAAVDCYTWMLLSI